MVLISPIAPAQSYIVQIVVPHALDGPKHGTSCNLLGRDLVDNPAGISGNQEATVNIITRKTYGVVTSVVALWTSPAPWRPGTESMTIPMRGR